MKRIIILITVSIFFFSIVLSVRAEKASLFIYPESDGFNIDDIFSVEVKMDTTGIPINASQAIIYFPTDKLEVVNISKEDSIFTLWTEEPVFSNSSGRISFAGGLPHPGSSGIENIITVNFRAKQEGIAKISLGQSQILANDGKGTNILVFVKEAKYSIQKAMASSETTPPPFFISSPTHSQQDEWYNNNNIRLQWKLDSSTDSVSFILDRNSDTIPDSILEGRIEHMAYKNVEDGIWYFHLWLKDTTGKNLVFHYKIQIDTSPPHLFEIIIDNAGDPTNPSPNLYFEAEDNTSGIDHYKIKVGKENFLNLMLAQINPFSLSFQTPGQRKVTVRAMDRAGNGVEAQAVIEVEPIDGPQIKVWPNTYISGEETFYIEGTSLPEVEIIIFLEKDGEKIKNWQTLANSQGEWSFSTKELIKSGIYYLSVQAKDKRGVISELSEEQRIEVIFSGISFGSFLISFKTLTLFLILASFLGIIIAGYFLYRIRRTKKILKREIQGSKESISQIFHILKKEMGEQVEMFDSKTGFSEKERELCNELKKDLDFAEDFVNKEIKDIEKK